MDIPSGLVPTDVKDPLAEYQHTVASKEDTRKLLTAVNRRLNEGGLPHDRLTKSFETWWPELESKLADVPKRTPLVGSPQDPMKQVMEMTREILQRVRESTRPKTIEQRNVYDEEERVDLASVVSSMLVEQLKEAGVPFSGVMTCTDGAYGIWKDGVRPWRVAEDLALGRISLVQMFADSRKEDHPCSPERGEQSRPARK